MLAQVAGHGGLFHNRGHECSTASKARQTRSIRASIKPHHPASTARCTRDMAIKTPSCHHAPQSKPLDPGLHRDLIETLEFTRPRGLHTPRSLAKSKPGYLSQWRPASSSWSSCSCNFPFLPVELLQANGKCRFVHPASARNVQADHSALLRHDIHASEDLVCRHIRYRASSLHKKNGSCLTQKLMRTVLPPVESTSNLRVLLYRELTVSGRSDP